MAYLVALDRLNIPAVLGDVQTYKFGTERVPDGLVVENDSAIDVTIHIDADDNNDGTYTLDVVPSKVVKAGGFLMFTNPRPRTRNLKIRGVASVAVNIGASLFYKSTLGL